MKAGNSEAALAQLREALYLQPDDPAIHEQVGDLELARGRTAEAGAAYRSALQYAVDGDARRRVRTKMRRGGV